MQSAGHPEVFVIGDTASLDQDGKPLPGVAQVAMQQGRFVGQVITNRETGRPAPQPFRYFDKGNMAVIGRGFAILDSQLRQAERAAGVAGVGFRPPDVSPGGWEPAAGLDTVVLVVFYSAT